MGFLREKRTAPVMPEKEAEAEVATELTTGEKLARYAEQHLCVICRHAAVCEVGRHTAELARESWLVLIADCSAFEDGRAREPGEEG